MRKILFLFLCIFIFLASCDQSEIPVKKSRTGICHAEGTRYYNQTKYFKKYKTIENCIKSGGRLPMRR